jgi:hypothetical protein
MCTNISRSYRQKTASQDQVCPIGTKISREKKKGSNNHDGNIIKILMEHMLPDRVNHSEFSFLWVDETQSNFLYPPLTQILLLSLLESDACVWLLSCFSLSFISLPNSPAQFKSSDSKTIFYILYFIRE